MARLSEALMRFFVNRTDCFCIQKRNGSFVKVDQPLTVEFVHKHLVGECTLGAYQLGLDTTVKWLCFDLDPEKLTDPEQAAKKIINVCFARCKEADGVERPRIWPHSLLLEASRYPDPSYHVWVLFNVPTYAKVGRWL
jgi:hypothetical protein